MPDITYSVNLKADKGFLGHSINVSSITANMSQTGMQSMTMTLTTNAVSISTAGLSSLGMAFLRNLSTTTASTAQIGISQGGSFVSLTTLRAGEPALFRMSNGTSYLAIGTSGTRLRVDILEG
jgi:hypothetical protein